MKILFRTCAVIATSCVVGAVAQASPQVELTFDDAGDGAGPATGDAIVNNLETKTGRYEEELIVATLVGTAVRSAITEGRYGRAADMVAGTGGLELAPWPTLSTTAIYVWLKVRDRSGGSVIAHGDSWDLHLEAGELVLGATDPVGDYKTLPTGAAWPADGDFHHLTFIAEAAEGALSIALAVDNDLQPPIVIDFLPEPTTAPLTIGAQGFDGLIDELLIRDDGVTDAIRFDRDPGRCPQGLTCAEEVIVVTPRDLGREVPVRLKWALDDALCPRGGGCPLLFNISGGNACPDDYADPASMRKLAALGFVAVTVDVYCEGDGATLTFPTETSQLIAVKDHLFGAGTYRDRIAGPEYMATGCSHGAGLVLRWALQEEDHPMRTFARSTALAGLCAHAAEAVCPAVIEAGLAKLGVTDLDPESALFHDAHERGYVEPFVTPELVRTREIARSWGKNLQGLVCDESTGVHRCNEEGLYGVTYSSLRFRDLWQRMEDESAPTGYFVEDHAEDCRHCANVNSKAFECGACFLQYGRSQMATACPAQCTSFDDPDITRGGPAAECPIEAGWYVDPLGDSGADPDSSPDTSSADDGDVADAEGDADTATAESERRGDSGGGCTSGVPVLPGLLFLVIVAVVRRPRRTSTLEPARRERLATDQAPPAEDMDRPRAPVELELVAQSPVEDLAPLSAAFDERLDGGHRLWRGVFAA